MSIFDSGDTGDSGGYTIANSLRLRSSASAYLSWTGAVSGGTPLALAHSQWVKRGALGAAQGLRATYVDANNSAALYFTSDDKICYQNYASGAFTAQKISTRAFRDPSAWLHVFLYIDTTESLAEDRFQIWVNGERITSWSTNTNTHSQSAGQVLGFAGASVTQYIGRGATGVPLDGYVAEVHERWTSVTGVTSFGQFNSDGVWVSKAYTGTYGAYGFYLKFNDGSSLTNLCLDRSGNGNHWTASGVSLTAGPTYDWMVDTPTNNYAVLNPLDNNGTLSEANLKFAQNASSYVSTRGSVGMTTGSWWWEVYINAGGAVQAIGISNSATRPVGAAAANAWMYDYDGVKYSNGVGPTAYGASYTTGDTLRFEFNADTRTLECFKNNVSQGVLASGLPADTYFPWVTLYGNNSVSFNFGQRPASGTPTTGYKAMCTANIPAAAITNPRLHHDVVTVTKSGNTNFTIPWDATLYDTYFEIKRRDAAGDWYQIDGLRGYDKVLKSNSTAAETTDANVLGVSGTTGTLKSTLADGTYVVSMWKAGLASARQTNTSGSITSTVSANVTAGFSIVVYSGTGANANVGHGLGVVPKDIRWKNRSSAVNWIVYNATIGAGNVLFLDATNASTANATAFNSTAPTSSAFSLGSYTNTNGSTHSMVAYCHAEVPGYSSFGSFACNASADGPVGYLSFTPKSLELKASTNASNWFDWDTVRSPYNPMGANGEIMFKNRSDAEGNSGHLVDANAGAFKVRTAGGYGYNESGQTTLFMAYAKHPFGGSNVAPAPAR